MWVPLWLWFSMPDCVPSVAHRASARGTIPGARLALRRRGHLAPGCVPMTCSGDEYGERVRRALEQELERVDSPETADQVVERVETLAAGKTAAGEAHRAARSGEPAAEHVERA